MSTLAEIEAAIEKLPQFEKQTLFTHLAAQIEQREPVKVAARSAAEDPFAAVIGAFEGAHEATGRMAEEILYGKGK